MDQKKGLFQISIPAGREDLAHEISGIACDETSRLRDVVEWASKNKMSVILNFVSTDEFTIYSDYSDEKRKNLELSNANKLAKFHRALNKISSLSKDALDGNGQS